MTQLFQRKPVVEAAAEIAAEAAGPADIAAVAVVWMAAERPAAASTRTIRKTLHQAATERCTWDNSYCYFLGLFDNDIASFVGVRCEIEEAEVRRRHH